MTPYLQYIRPRRPSLAWVIVLGLLTILGIVFQFLSVATKSFISGDRQLSWARLSPQNYLYKQPPLQPVFHDLPSAISGIYVISLPQRADRRVHMDALKASLNLNWTYKDAYDANATAISAILQQVRVFRHQLISQLSLGGVSLGTGTSGISAFGWPHDIDGGPSSQEFMLPHGADLWTLPSSHASSYSGVNDETPDSYALAHLSTESIPGGVDSVPLACASGNQTLAVYSDSLPLHMHLTAAKVACWYSHLQTIRAIANGSQEAALVLEDDVDMEIDTGKRLQALWGALPGEWDIVYLGHCWSDEAQLPPLRSISLRLTNGRLTSSALHPASAPKCTHAYALSRTGARRIVAHLRYPPFAYSRAIDQALAWLVESGRLRAFSVVPSVAVQRKVTGSDVMPGLGSAWRDGLYNGVLSGVIG